MITDIAVKLLITGNLPLDTIPIKLMLVSKDIKLVKTATSASSLKNDATMKVIDANIPTGFIDVTAIVKADGVALVTNPRVIKMLAPQWVGGVLIFAEGVYGNVDDPIISYTSMPLEKYYNIAMVAAGEYIIKFNN